MTIERTTTTCIVVHLADSEAHFSDAQQAEAWAEKLDAGIRIHAIEEAQEPCWMAYCDEPACQEPEGDENDNATHLVGQTAQDAERGLTDLRRVAGGALLCTACREEQTTP